MVKIHTFKAVPIIELSKTDLSNIYVNFYIDGKLNSEKSFSCNRLLSLDEILNSKSISVEYIKKKILGQICCKICYNINIKVKLKNEKT